MNGGLLRFSVNEVLTKSTDDASPTIIPPSPPVTPSVPKPEG
jgi:hypothetical protein